MTLKLKWYKRDPDAALIGMMPLTDIEYRAYGVIIDLLYSRKGDLDDDPRLICTYTGWRPQRWLKARAGLLAKGKIHLKTDGKLTANRVETELKLAENLMEKMGELGRISSEKRKKSKGDRQRAVSTAPFGTTTSTSREEEEKPSKGFSSSSEYVERGRGAPARSLASALPSGALALSRSTPPSEPTTTAPAAAKRTSEVEGDLRADGSLAPDSVPAAANSAVSAVSAVSAANPAKQVYGGGFLRDDPEARHPPRVRQPGPPPGQDYFTLAEIHGKPNPAADFTNERISGGFRRP